MKKWEVFVTGLSTDECEHIINDYEEYRRVGKTGESLLRQKTKEWCDSTILYFDSAMMDKLALECYKRRYHQLKELANV
jgi:hypothetical protein